MGADMQPGPEMDRLVAEAVGWRWNARNGYDCSTCSCEIVGCTAIQRVGDDTYVTRYPSHSDVDAIAALEATNEEFSIHRDSCQQEGWRWVVEIFGRTISRADCETLPEAACRAILAWREAENHD